LVIFKLLNILMLKLLINGLDFIVKKACIAALIMNYITKKSENSKLYINDNIF